MSHHADGVRQSESRPIRTEYSVEFDPSDPASLDYAITEAINAVTGTDPTDFVLYRAIDVGALGKLFPPEGEGSPRVDGTVSFALAPLDCRVVVESSGTVRASSL